MDHTYCVEPSLRQPDREEGEIGSDDDDGKAAVGDLDEDAGRSVTGVPVCLFHSCVLRQPDREEGEIGNDDDEIHADIDEDAERSVTGVNVLGKIVDHEDLKMKREHCGDCGNDDHHDDDRDDVKVHADLVDCGNEVKDQGDKLYMPDDYFNIIVGHARDVDGSKEDLNMKMEDCGEDELVDSEEHLNMQKEECCDGGDDDQDDADGDDDKIRADHVDYRGKIKVQVNELCMPDDDFNIGVNCGHVMDVDVCEQILNMKRELYADDDNDDRDSADLTDDKIHADRVDCGDEIQGQLNKLGMPDAYFNVDVPVTGGHVRDVDVNEEDLNIHSGNCTEGEIVDSEEGLNTKKDDCGDGGNDDHDDANRDGDEITADHVDCGDGINVQVNELCMPDDDFSIHINGGHVRDADVSGEDLNVKRGDWSEGEIVDSEDDLNMQKEESGDGGNGDLDDQNDDKIHAGHVDCSNEINVHELCMPVDDFNIDANGGIVRVVETNPIVDIDNVVLKSTMKQPDEVPPGDPFGLYRDGDDDSSVSSLDSLDDEPDVINTISTEDSDSDFESASCKHPVGADKNGTERSSKVKKIPRTKGELLLEDLPPIEDLQIDISDSIQMREVGKISSVVGILVVIQSDKGVPALDADTILFLDGKRVLGQIFETFGPVCCPFYSIRFNSLEHIQQHGVEVGAHVFYVPDNVEWTHYVFFEHLKTLRGSDASWKDNNEPPAWAVDYSDDEAERRASAKSRQKTNDENLGEENSKPKKNKPVNFRNSGSGRQQSLNVWPPPDSPRPHFQPRVRHQRPRLEKKQNPFGATAVPQNSFAVTSVPNSHPSFASVMHYPPPTSSPFGQPSQASVANAGQSSVNVYARPPILRPPVFGSLPPVPFMSTAGLVSRPPPPLPFPPGTCNAPPPPYPPSADMNRPPPFSFLPGGMSVPPPPFTFPLGINQVPPSSAHTSTTIVYRPPPLSFPPSSSTALPFQSPCPSELMSRLPPRLPFPPGMVGPSPAHLAAAPAAFFSRPPPPLPNNNIYHFAPR